MTEHETAPPGTAPSHASRPAAVIQLVLAIGAVLLVGLALLIALAGHTQFGARSAGLAWAVAGVAGALGAWHLLASVRLVRGGRVFSGGAVQLVLGAVAAASPGLSRLALPLEHPETYDGSPLAAFIGVVILLVPALGYGCGGILVLTLRASFRGGPAVERRR